MKIRSLGLWASAALLIAGSAARADENLANFGNVSSATAPGPAAPDRPLKKSKQRKAAAEKSPQVSDPFGPVPTGKLISLVNVAPGLLAYFNSAPVFGLPGTVTGDIWRRTQLLGDWGGTRTELAQKGFFFDIYSTSYYQNITSGGLKTGGAFVQNTQFSVNIDTARAGWWSGGIIHATAQWRTGDSPANTFTAGSAVPQYTGLVYPDPQLSHDILPTEYYLVQALSQQFSVVLGKISNIFIPDQTAFGSSYKYHFANFNFNKNPMTPNFYNPTSLAALGIWALSPKFAIAGGVLDPYSKADNLASHAFEHVNLYLMAVMSYDIAGLPGQFSPAFNWSNKPKLDLETPFGTLTSVAAVRQAVGGMLGANSLDGLPTNSKDESWFAIANASQYFFVKDDPETVHRKLKSGELIRGVGVFARVGYAPEETNIVARDASIALFAHGMIDGRDYDSFGIGVYHNQISGKFKTDIGLLTRGAASASDETGMEVFYNFAITPAVRLIPSYQHIWHPLSAQVADGHTSTDIFQTRLTIAW
ncbi:MULTISPECIES: carbohydrate porin [Bradyrhizobium]|uniref:carbohydrate porin n=1 Tax=Bradyrhizobium elkanii TaxID=29448 RepID=UPI0004244268|nr:carbohydrate porin [Bradyrhizobium elkanii]